MESQLLEKGKNCNLGVADFGVETLRNHAIGPRPIQWEFTGDGKKCLIGSENRFLLVSTRFSDEHRHSSKLKLASAHGLGQGCASLTLWRSVSSFVPGSVGQKYCRHAPCEPGLGQQLMSTLWYILMILTPLCASHLEGSNFDSCLGSLVYGSY
jgi:hypothetical protein